jgi:hypothetical protein
LRSPARRACYADVVAMAVDSTLWTAPTHVDAMLKKLIFGYCEATCTAFAD